MMNILYLGDVYGEPGIKTVEEVLPGIKADLVIAQSENVSEGRSLLPEDRKRLQKAGVDFFTGGNWSLHRPEAVSDLENPDIPVIRPANYPVGTPGKGWKYIDTAHGKVLVISLLGSIVGKDADNSMDNPLKVIDRILEANKATNKAATVINFHGDYSSEKVIIGHYLDGRVTAVLGDHWHTATADARVLPGGTAHITDVGMCGTLDSSLGVAFSSVIPRWRDGKMTRNVVEPDGPRQFNAVLIKADPKTGLAESITHIRRIIN